MAATLADIQNITKQQEKKMIRVVPEEIKEDRNNVIKKLWGMGLSQKVFISMDQLPWRGMYLGYFEREITMKSECICEHYYSSDIPPDNVFYHLKGKRMCDCKYKLISTFVKYNKKYGLLFEWKVMTNNMMGYPYDRLK